MSLVVSWGWNTLLGSQVLPCRLLTVSSVLILCAWEVGWQKGGAFTRVSNTLPLWGVEMLIILCIALLGVSTKEDQGHPLRGFSRERTVILFTNATSAWKNQGQHREHLPGLLPVDYRTLGSVPLVLVHSVPAGAPTPGQQPVWLGANRQSSVPQAPGVLAELPGFPLPGEL